MQELIERIRKDGRIKPGNVLKVDSFLNHQIDPKLAYAMAQEIKRLYADETVNKVLTIEASGIGLAVLTGYLFECPVVFAKKSKSSNVSDDLYTAKVHSYTHGTDHTVIVSKSYLNPEDRVLIVDDFLANGAALEGLRSTSSSPALSSWAPPLPSRRRSSPAEQGSEPRVCASSLWQR